MCCDSNICYFLHKASVKCFMADKKIKIVIRKLGRERALGQAFESDNLIEIDPRQSEKEFLSTVIHETLHILFPNLSEKMIIKNEKSMCDVIWKLGYRRNDKH